MTTSIEQLTEWMSAPKETEFLEFKEAGNHFDNDKLARYCVAIANEGGGNLILGITDKLPRRVVGTNAFRDVDKAALRILDTTGFRVDPKEIQHPEGRVLVFHIPSRPRGTAYAFEGGFWMRSGESLVPMSEDQLRKIFAEGKPEWLLEPAKKGCDGAEIIALLDTQTYFDLLEIPYPSSRGGVLEKLKSEGFILAEEGKWTIINIAAILLAKNLETFSSGLARKAPRVVAYEGTNKIKTRAEHTGQKGYAVGFENLLEFVHNLAPANKVIEEAVREDVQMFPKQALRELIANALIHQEFMITGASVMIDMYADRIEISNPGTPPISPERFIDEYQSRNEKLAAFMRRAGICEEKGSGIDKVIEAAEVYQLPAPDFRVGEIRTTAVLFAHQDFSNMSKNDRIRACYQHCCLMYVGNKSMTNQSLRDRFRLSESKSATVSQIITAAQESGKIKLDDGDTTSRRYAKYMPYWA